MDKYLQAEKRLAELLGYTKVRIADSFNDRYSKLCAERKDGENVTEGILPQWCRDDASAFRLMIEYECYPQEAAGTVTVAGDDFGPRLRAYSFLAEHPDKAIAVRYVVVKAVIAKLEAQNG